MSEERAAYLASGTGSEPADRERLDLIREILAQDVTWSEPPPQVADRLLDAVVSHRKAADPVVTPPSRRWWWAAAAAGIAAAAVVVAGPLGVFSAPDDRVIAMTGTDLEPAASGEVAIRETEAGWWIRLDLDDLPAAADGSYYEGWVWNDEGDGVSIGTFHLRGGDDPVVLWSGVDPAEYPAIWVTLEDEDGDPAASGRIVMWGRPEDG